MGWAKCTRLATRAWIARSRSRFCPPGWPPTPQFRERFGREARTISQLTHPHICTLYDVGDEHGAAFLVMEHLVGTTLAERLVSGPLPTDQALKAAVEIASALDKAHRAGIIHRDLKPGNIMLTRDGAKLLDFGLAKDQEPVAAGTRQSMVPTTPGSLTGVGTILGTLQYMAPEQLEGREADTRTDIFAFGAVLYEMLAGRKAFEGNTSASLIGDILKDEPPPVSSLRPLSPASLDRVVRKCLAKDPDARWQSAHDLHDELAWIAADSTAPVAVPHRPCKAIARAGGMDCGTDRRRPRSRALGPRFGMAGHDRRLRCAGDAPPDRDTAGCQSRGLRGFTGPPGDRLPGGEGSPWTALAAIARLGYGARAGWNGGRSGGGAGP